MALKSVRGKSVVATTHQCLEPGGAHRRRTISYRRRRPRSRFFMSVGLSARPPLLSWSFGGNNWRVDYARCIVDKSGQADRRTLGRGVDWNIRSLACSRWRWHTGRGRPQRHGKLRNLHTRRLVLARRVGQRGRLGGSYHTPRGRHSRVSQTASATGQQRRMILSNAEQWSVASAAGQALHPTAAASLLFGVFYLTSSRRC